ncbi:MAG: ferrochelatase [Oligoflexus sp.]
MATSLPTGVLIINLGSPDSTSVADVRRYLRQFLMDGRVIDIPSLARWFLVHAIILPTRPKRSAHAYKKIWTEQGSPLLVEGRNLVKGLQQELGSSYVVELAMRYGRPSMDQALENLIAKSCERIIVFPLYPQYASASTGSIYEELMRIIQGRWNMPAINFVGDFYEDPRFIDAFVSIAQPQLTKFQADHVLFSYHGLPVRHLQKSDPTGQHCVQPQFNCCDAINAQNRFCYRAQCMATTRALVRGLRLQPDQHSVSFQSRLGRAEWVKPYTDEVMPELASKGYKRLAVMCPAFVADCLETLEEIGMEGRKQWLECGGEDFHLITSLNAETIWVKNLAAMVEERIPRISSGM